MADEPTGGPTRSEVGAVLARVGVALGAFLVVQLVCAAAGWDASWYGVLTGFAAYLAFDRFSARRRERAREQRDAGPAPRT